MHFTGKRYYNFGHVVSKDLTGILRDIRDTHRKDATTADESCAALEVQKQLQDAMDYKGSTVEKKARLFLTNLGIDYDAITKEEFANSFHTKPSCLSVFTQNLFFRLLTALSPSIYDFITVNKLSKTYLRRSLREGYQN